MDGAVVVGAGVEKVRVPRLPKLLPPPIRASAVLATSASAIVAAPSVASTRPKRIMDTSQMALSAKFCSRRHIGLRPALGKGAA
jgi:hypothetical protein